MKFVLLQAAFLTVGALIFSWPETAWAGLTALCLIALFTFIKAQDLFSGKSKIIARIFTGAALAVSLFAHSVGGMALMLALLGKCARTRRKQADLGPWFIPALKKDSAYRQIICAMLILLTLAAIYGLKIAPYTLQAALLPANIPP